jgi:cell division protein ZapA (FtsZ GTPase activity inhibitor)
MANSVSVTIYGQRFTVNTEESPERVEALAAKVDSLMRMIASRGYNDSNRAAILASLHLADQVVSLEERVADMESAAEKVKSKPAQKKRINDLLSLLDQELETPKS